MGQKAKYSLRAHVFRFAPDSGLMSDIARGPKDARSGCSAVWVKPPKYRNAEACKQGEDLQADCHPVPDRRGISLNSPLRRGCEQPVQKITTAKGVCDSSLDKAGPKRAAAIEAQIDCDDARENFIEEKLHSKIR
jgi:hypothetical protein